MSRTATLPKAHKPTPPLPEVKENDGDDTAEASDHYSSPKVPARPSCPPRPSTSSPAMPPVPAVRKKVATREEPATQTTLRRVSQPPAGLSPYPHMSPPSPIPANQVPPAEAEDNFGNSLQSARDCINKRHDEELKALESFRTYMHKRAKAEAEYAATLGKIWSQVVRDTAGLSASSNIVQTWTRVLEALDTIQKKTHRVSKQVEETIVKTTDQLIKEKRGIKTAYDIGRSQLDAEYRDSCDQVHQLKKEYCHMLQATEAAKQKLEKLMQKSSTKRQADIDRLYARFVSSSEKLHKCHNDYTFSILNANVHLDHYHKSTVPFCLNTLQERMELVVSQWRGIMEEYIHTIDMSDVYQESFGKLYTALKKLNPKDEYISLIKEHKSNEGHEEEPFTFDAALLEHHCAPKVEANKLSINDLTYDNLRAELSRMERRLEEIENERLEKEKQSIVLDDGNIFKERPDAEVPKAVIRANLQAERRRLDCQIEREKVKIAKLKENLNEMGKSLPSFDSMGTIVAGSSASHLTSTEISDTKPQTETLSRNASASNSTSIYQLQTLSPHVSGETEDDKDEGSDSYETFQPGDVRLEDEGWFYADMERREAEMKCKNSGDYLIRYSPKQSKYVLTVNSAGQVKHFFVQESVESNQARYRLESKSFPSIKELLHFHSTTQTPVTKASAVILMQPVLKRSDKWSLQHNEIKMGKKLGKGAFGDVFEAEYKGQKVAVKTCRSTDVPDREKFLQEAEILKQYDHPNIVKLIGIAWEDEPVLIVMELMPGGSLLDYLRKKAGGASKGKLLIMSINACSGMEYLESKGCIHRDLAARNCLVGDSDIVKISDFGMSREEDIYYSKGPRQIPIKWTAPEALNRGMYTAASDVWSFGILLWEVFSGGSVPYPGMSNADARDRVDEGYRMPPPSGCPKEVHNIMQQCWMPEPEERPNFSRILGMLKAIEGTIT